MQILFVKYFLLVIYHNFVGYSLFMRCVQEFPAKKKMLLLFFIGLEAFVQKRKKNYIYFKEKRETANIFGYNVDLNYYYTLYFSTHGHSQIVTIKVI